MIAITYPPGRGCFSHNNQAVWQLFLASVQCEYYGYKNNFQAQGCGNLTTLSAQTDMDLKEAISENRFIGIWRLLKGYSWLYIGAILGVGIAAVARTGTYLLLGYYVANNLATVGLQTFVAKVEIAKNQSILFMAALVQLIVTLFVVILTDDPYLYALTFVVGAFVTLFISYFYLSQC